MLFQGWSFFVFVDNFFFVQLEDKSARVTCESFSFFTLNYSTAKGNEILADDLFCVTRTVTT